MKENEIDTNKIGFCDLSELSLYVIENYCPVAAADNNSLFVGTAISTADFS